MVAKAEPAGADHAGPAPDVEVAGLGYEQARDALVDVVRRLEGGNLTLEESLALWERGEALAEACRLRLEGARTRFAAAVQAPAAEVPGGPGGSPDQG